MAEAENKRKRGLAALWFMLAAFAVSGAFIRLHGRPAFVAGLAGGILLVLGFVTLFRGE
ncbi:MAG TPA: hypothetical protein VEH49_08025 [Methylomirabilota bacterium]|nr:hypothetical protein [Methylomirabilota bacterium]